MNQINRINQIIIKITITLLHNCNNSNYILHQHINIYGHNNLKILSKLSKI
jgi:hypothetical protein